MPTLSSYLANCEYYNVNNCQMTGEYGPFQIGSDLFTVGVVNDAANTDTGSAIAACKSSDAGVTWAEQDSAHHPFIGSFAAAWTNGSVIECLIDDVPLGATSRIIQFDPVSGWQTPTATGGPPFGTNYDYMIGAVRRSPSSVVAFYLTGRYHANLYAAEWDGSSWSTLFLIRTSSAGPSQVRLNAVAIDGVSGNLQLMYEDHVSYQVHLFHRTLFANNTLGAEFDFGSTIPASPHASVPVEFLSALYWPIFDNASGDLSFLVGTPAAAPTSWATVLAVNLPGITILDICSIAAGGTISVVFSDFVNTGLWLSQSTDGIAWSAPVFYGTPPSAANSSYLCLRALPGGLGMIGGYRPGPTQDRWEYYTPFAATAPRARYFAW